MKSFFRRGISCLLCVILVFSTCISAFAVESEQETPVIVINDINKNPLYNLDDGSVVFDWANFQKDILFTTGFSENILELFSKDMIDKIKNGDTNTLDMITVLLDYFGFMGDINDIIAKVISLVTDFMAKYGQDGLSLDAIIKNIDFKEIVTNLKTQLEQEYKNLESIKMNDDGTPANENIGAISYEENLEVYSDEMDYDAFYAVVGDIAETIAEKIGYENTYVFTYDWRLAPSVNAEKLKTQIEKVKADTDADKVSVISEGYGSVVATEYLALNEDAADSIKNFVTVSSEFLGTSIMGDLFTNNLVNEFTKLEDFTSAYIRYTNDISDNPITAYTTWLINYILNREHEVQDFCFHVEEMIANLHFGFIYSGAKAELVKMPGMWALVPAETFEAAVDAMFKDEPNETFLATITEYNDHQYYYEDILNDAKDSGINISVVSLWDIQILPIGNTFSVQSDGVVDTSYSSFGATCVEINSVAYAMRAVQEIEDGHMHQSESYDMLTPLHELGGICRYIDASTCALPENTWFIKNMKHGTFTYDSNSMQFLHWLVLADAPTDVHQRAEYKQFMTYNRFINPGILSSGGYVAPDPDTPAEHYLLGDINLDGLVTSLDAKLAYDYCAGNFDIEEDSVPFVNGDVYTDGIINEADARRILLMSSGLIEGMQSGIKYEYDTADCGLEKSDYSLELRPEYNCITNKMKVDLVLLDAEDSICGNFIFKYDTEMFTYLDTDENKIDGGFVVAGEPTRADAGTITCSFAVSDEIDEQCNDDGDFVVATFYFGVAKKIKSVTELNVGTAYFYDSVEEITYIEPVTLSLDEDFFIMLGDANNDRKITAIDARLILRIAIKLEKVLDDDMFIRCDVNKDGKITPTDARLVLRAAMKLIDSYDEVEDSTVIVDDVTI